MPRNQRPESDPLGGCRDRRQRDLGVPHRRHRLAPADVVPDEESIPAGLLRLAGETRDDRRIGQWVEEREGQSGTHALASVALPAHRVASSRASVRLIGSSGGPGSGVAVAMSSDAKVDWATFKIHS